MLTLNAGYSQGMTSPDGPQKLTLPLHKAHLFKQRLAKMPLPQQPPPLPYGGGLVDVSFVTPGNSLTSLPSTGPSVSLPAAAATAEVKTQQHLVSKGEFLEQIATRYGTSVTQLRRLNRLRGNLVKVGTLLTVPVSPTVGVTPSPTTQLPTSPVFLENDQVGPMAGRK
jgi:hypothetical protein